MLISNNENLTIAPLFHFYNANCKEALVVTSEFTDESKETIEVKVPNILLQEALMINVFMFAYSDEDSGKSLAEIRIHVHERIKPSSYTYVENIDKETANGIRTDLMNEINEFKKAVNSEVKEFVSYSGNQDLSIEQKEIARDNIDTVGKKVISTSDGIEIVTTSEIFNDYRAREKQIDDNAVTVKIGNEASNEYAHAEGTGTTASGRASHAEGYCTQALLNQSHAEGISTIASGKSSHAEGFKTYANEYSHAEGINTSATGKASRCGGYALKSYYHLVEEFKNSSEYQNASSLSKVVLLSNKVNDILAKEPVSIANGDYSFSHGVGTIAGTNCETVFGIYNALRSGDNAGIFMVGNGTCDDNYNMKSRSNAFRVGLDGKCYGLANFQSSGADFAEYFEWLDGNPDKEDRRGKFVTLDGDKIRFATSEDEYILGIVSGSGAFIGNSASEVWQGMYQRDIYGDLLTEDVEIPEKIDEETGNVTPSSTMKQLVLNPRYNPNQEYISREFRKEWSPIGMIGQVVAVDDGTCKVNGYCKPSVDGIATASESGYRVMKRIDENHILVLMR